MYVVKTIHINGDEFHEVVHSEQAANDLVDSWKLHEDIVEVTLVKNLK